MAQRPIWGDYTRPNQLGSKEHTEAAVIPTHLPNRSEQSADYLPGFAAAEGNRLAYTE